MTTVIAIFFTLVAALSCGNVAVLIVSLRRYWKNSSIKTSWVLVSIMAVMVTGLSIYAAYHAWNQL